MKAFCKSFFISKSLSEDLAIPMTNQPRLTSSREIASPIPDEAPVTNATCLFIFISFSGKWIHFWGVFSGGNPFINDSQLPQEGLGTYEGEMMAFQPKNPTASRQEGLVHLTVDYASGVIQGIMETTSGSHLQFIGLLPNHTATFYIKGQDIGTFTFNFYGTQAEEIGGIVNFNGQIGVLGLKKTIEQTE